MKKTPIHISILLFFTAFNLHSRAQAPIEISNLNKVQYYYLQDVSVYSTQNKLSIDSILKIDERHFKQNPDLNTYNASSSNRYNWFRFTLKNTNKDSLIFKIVNGNNQINEMELFRVADNKAVSEGITGRIYPFSHRPYPFLHFTYPISLKANEKVTFIFFADCRGISYRIMLFLLNNDSFKKGEQRLYITYGIFIGILLLSSLFNLFLFAFNKERIHFAYSLYSVFVILSLMSLQSLDFQYLYPNHPHFTRTAISTYTSITTFLLIWVMQLFLKQSPKNSKFYWLATYLKWLCGIVPFIGFYVVNFTDSIVWIKVYLTIYPLTLILAFLLVITCCIEKLLQGYNLAFFYLAAVSLVLISGSVMAYGLINRKYYLSMPPTFMDISMVAEALIICFGILFRYILIKREKDRLKSEIEVQQFVFANQIIETQEQERKRIAADLHDELGGNLAAIKMNLHILQLPEEKMAGIVHLIDLASNNARNISHDLMPPEFECTNLNDLLIDYFNKLNKNNKTHFIFHSSDKVSYFNKQDELMLYRVILELANNIIKHARATEATIQLVYYNTHLELMAEDNGKGFSNNQSEGIGLKNIYSRINYLNGKIDIDSTQHGSTIIIQVPYKPKNI